jgi:hypothetical protein
MRLRIAFVLELGGVGVQERLIVRTEQAKTGKFFPKGALAGLGK